MRLSRVHRSTRGTGRLRPHTLPPDAYWPGLPRPPQYWSGYSSASGPSSGWVQYLQTRTSHSRTFFITSIYRWGWLSQMRHLTTLRVST